MREVVVGIIPRNISPDNTEYLLMSSKKNFGEFSGLYYPPGGHLEADEDEKTALSREIEEELGIKVIPLRKLATTPGDVKEQVTHWWLCDSLPEEASLTIKSEEVADARYFSSNEIKEGSKLWPATKKFFEKYIFSKK